MTGKMSTVGDNYALDIATGRAAGPGARTMYLALLSAAPGDATTMGTMTEITTSGYARQSVTWSAPTGQPASSSNSAQITFGPFSAATPSVGWCCLVSASSGTSGDLTMYWTLNAAKTAAIGESMQVAASGLTMTQA